MIPLQTLPSFILLVVSSISQIALSAIVPASSSSSFLEAGAYPPIRLVQAWNPEVGENGSWLIRTLEIDSPVSNTCKSVSSISSEKIISLISSNSAFQSGELEKAEGEWVEREAGEGIEETWARAFPSSLISRIEFTKSSLHSSFWTIPIYRLPRTRPMNFPRSNRSSRPPQVTMRSLPAPMISQSNQFHIPYRFLALVNHQIFATEWGLKVCVKNAGFLTGLSASDKTDLDNQQQNKPKKDGFK